MSEMNFFRIFIGFFISIRIQMHSSISIMTISIILDIFENSYYYRITRIKIISENNSMKNYISEKYLVKI